MPPERTSHTVALAGSERDQGRIPNGRRRPTAPQRCTVQVAQLARPQRASRATGSQREIPTSVVRHRGASVLELGLGPRPARSPAAQSRAPHAWQRREQGRKRLTPPALRTPFAAMNVEARTQARSRRWRSCRVRPPSAERALESVAEADTRRPRSARSRPGRAVDRRAEVCSRRRRATGRTTVAEARPHRRRGPARRARPRRENRQSSAELCGRAAHPLLRQVALSGGGVGTQQLGCLLEREDLGRRAGGPAGGPPPSGRGLSVERLEVLVAPQSVYTRSFGCELSLVLERRALELPRRHGRRRRTNRARIFFGRIHR